MKRVRCRDLARLGLSTVLASVGWGGLALPHCSLSKMVKGEGVVKVGVEDTREDICYKVEYSCQHWEHHETYCRC